ncbi:MAG: ATP-binding protein [Acidimicrobiia bacterium]
MAELDARRLPRRFRRRLTLAFIGVGAAAAGMLAVTSYLLIQDHRESAFRQRAEAQAELAAVAIGRPATEAEFATSIDEYRVRGEAEVVAVDGEAVYSSAAEFGRASVPIAGTLELGDVETFVARAAGQRHYVVGRGLSDGLELYLFFSEAEIHASLADFRNVLIVGWAGVVVGSAIVGVFVARRTLRPVGAAAQASRQLAEGLLDTRLETHAADEFGVWAHCFNEMADALAARISELSEAQQRERRFTSDVAHELRTPLAGMTGAATLLADHLDELPASARRPAEILVHDIQLLSELVLELLELARMDAGREGLNLEDLNLRQAVTAVASAVPGVGTVELAIPEDVWVVADRARFRRVLGNLLANAAEHGGGRVEVGARVVNGAVLTEVRDHGPGIADEAQGRIFDRFYKADTSRSRRGTGLGLAIALQHAQAQGGSLVAGNAPGGGAVFTFTLPAGAADPGDEPDPAGQSAGVGGVVP